MEKYRICVVYTPDAIVYYREFAAHLGLFKEIVEISHRELVRPGIESGGTTPWTLQGCDCLALFVSPELLGSDFFERPAFRAYHKRGAESGVYPIYISPCAWEKIPEIREFALRDGSFAQNGPLKEKGLEEQREFWKRAVPRLLGLSKRVRQNLNIPEPARTEERPEPYLRRLAPASARPDPRFGPLLERLDAALDARETALAFVHDPTHSGMTELARGWIERLARSPAPAARRRSRREDAPLRLFGWSFHDDVNVHGQIADFFYQAGRFFHAALPPEPSARARSLAEKYLENPTVIVLDRVPAAVRDVDPAQADAQTGSLALFLDEIRRRGPGASRHLLLVTSAAAPETLLPAPGDDTPCIDLAPWNKVQIRDWLTAAGQPAGSMLETMTDEIAVTSGGNPHRARLCTGAHGTRVYGTADAPRPAPGTDCLDMLERRWTRDDAPERRFLWVLSVFDRPAAANEWMPILRRLFAEDALWSDDARVGTLITELHSADLIFRGSGTPDLDTDKWVRRYFRRQFRSREPELWRAANLALFELLSARPSDEQGRPLEQPGTPRELDDLIRAVIHGCRAQTYAPALHTFNSRLLADARTPRLAEALRRFGSLTDLVKIIEGFPPPSAGTAAAAEWEALFRPHLLLGAGFAHLGRLREARQVISANLMHLGEVRRQLHSRGTPLEYVDAALLRSCTDLADVCLFTGDLAAARSVLQQALALADGPDRNEATQRDDEGPARVAAYTCQAGVLVQQGSLREALSLFEKAGAELAAAGGIALLDSLAAHRLGRLKMDMAQNDEMLFNIIGRFSAIDSLREENRRAEPLNDAVADAVYRLNVAQALTALGAGRAAIEYSSEARKTIERTDFNLFKAAACLINAAALRRAGSVYRAVDLVREALLWSSDERTRAGLERDFAQTAPPADDRRPSAPSANLLPDLISGLLLLAQLYLDLRAYILENQDKSPDVPGHKWYAGDVESYLERAGRAVERTEALLQDGIFALYEPDLLLVKARFVLYSEGQELDALQILHQARKRMVQMEKFGLQRELEAAEEEIFKAIGPI